MIIIFNYIDVLKKSILFKNVNANILENIFNEYCTVISANANTVLINEKDNTDNLYLILKGKAEVYKNYSSNKVMLKTLTEGEFYGIASLFNNSVKFPTTIIAKQDCEILCITEENLKQILIKESKISLNYIYLLSEKIEYLNNKISTFTSIDANSKLLTYLHQNSENNKITISNFTKLATILNLGRASLYRSFDNLQKNGIIKREGKNISLLKNKEF